MTEPESDAARPVAPETRPEDLLVAGLCLLVAAVVASESLPRYAGRQGPGPGAFPTWIALLLAVCAAVILARVARERRLAPAIRWPRGEALRRVLLATVSLVAYLVLLPLLGFLLSSALLLLLHFKTVGGYPWRIAVPTAVVAALLVWYLFGVLLRVPLPSGLLGL